LILAAAAAHAGWNAILKNSSDKFLALLGMRIFALPILLVSTFFVSPPQQSALPYMAVHVAFIYGYFIFLLNAYKAGDFSAVYPIVRGVPPVIVLITTGYFHIDVLSQVDILSTISISFGIIFFALFSKLSLTTFCYAVATGIMIAGYTVMSGMGVRVSGSILGYIIWSEILICIGPILFYLLSRKQGVIPYLKQNSLSVSMSSTLAISAFGLVLWTFNYLPVGPVAAVRESSIAFAVIFGAIFFKEKIQAHKIIGLFLITIGVIFLALQK
jgi:drug/metabolite transporter (DMT)-like permease